MLTASTVANGVELSFTNHGSPPAESSNNWSSVTANVDDNRRAFDLDLVLRGEKLFADELDEFRDAIGELEQTAGSRWVIEQLNQATFIVAMRVPNDIDDTGWQAVDSILDHLIERNGAMIQADGEGFYRDAKLIVELE